MGINNALIPSDKIWRDIYQIVGENTMIAVIENIENYGRYYIRNRVWRDISLAIKGSINGN